MAGRYSSAPERNLREAGVRSRVEKTLGRRQRFRGGIRKPAWDGFRVADILVRAPGNHRRAEEDGHSHVSSYGSTPQSLNRVAKEWGRLCRGGLLPKISEVDS